MCQRTGRLPRCLGRPDRGNFVAKEQDHPGDGLAIGDRGVMKAKSVIKTKIFRSTFLVAAVVFISCMLLILGVLREHFEHVQEGQLQMGLMLAAAGAGEEPLSYLQKLEKGKERLTLVAPDGTVLYDTWMDASGMENHKDREEIREALQEGAGQSARYSGTLMEKTLYYASRLPGGEVLRISAGRLTWISLFLWILQPIVIVIGIALILSAALSARLAQQITGPQEKER